MKRFWIGSFAALSVLAMPVAGQAQSQINVICSALAEWCNGMATGYAKATGVKVNLAIKGSGEALAQLVAEKDNPKTDLWFGGTGDPHLQAAEMGLTAEYKSDRLPELRDWARKQAEQSKFRTVGIYLGPLGFGYNTELLAKRKMPVPQSWADLLNPVYKGEIQVANPASSGTAYTMIATLVQIMGEEKAFDYLKKLNANIGQYTRSGTAPIKATARGETAVSISFVHDGSGEKAQGFPIDTITPNDGTGAEVGSMSLVRGSRNLAAAKKLYDWALTPEAQVIAAQTKSYQIPSNAKTPLDPNMPDVAKIKLIDYDYAKYGKSDERKRLISRWEKEVGSLPR